MIVVKLVVNSDTGPGVVEIPDEAQNMLTDMSRAAAEDFPGVEEAVVSAKAA